MAHQYRKKPVVVEAWQFNPNAAPTTLPDWLWASMLKGEAKLGHDRGGAATLSITTREGVMRADQNDWIIRGVDGELYPCKPEIFAKTYDAVPEVIVYPSGGIKD